MDSTRSPWLTDCRSLSDHLTNTTGGEVSDKRLAIDLTDLARWESHLHGLHAGRGHNADPLDLDQNHGRC